LTTFVVKAVDQHSFSNGACAIGNSRVPLGEFTKPIGPNAPTAVTKLDPIFSSSSLLRQAAQLSNTHQVC
jgi:hypothetical protein